VWALRSKVARSYFDNASCACSRGNVAVLTKYSQQFDEKGAIVV
jgi:hypothetical protein